jgi:ElaB/YqjD/DUF883 family membrane-anchored ribosome-binding protein
MANSSLRKASLQSMEAEIESLLKSLENLKDDASDESRKTLKALKGNAENALRHSRHLLADAYEEVKVKTRETGSLPGTTPRNTLGLQPVSPWGAGSVGGLSVVQTR